MSSVRLEFRPALGQALGLTGGQRVLQRPIEDGEFLADVLARLAAENPAIATRVYAPDERQINSLVQVSLNGRLLPLVGGVGVPLADRDEVLFFYAAGGG